MGSMQVDTNGPPATTGFPVHPQDQYTERLPSPPRIQVLPPKDYTVPRLPTQLNGPSNLFSHITLDTTSLPIKTWGDWAYNDRRLAQPILPFLYLGPFQAVKDHEFLRAAGITLIIYARHTKAPQPGQHPTTIPSKHPVLSAAEAALLSQSQPLQTLTIDLTSTSNLASSFASTNSLITSHFAAKAAQSRLNPDHTGCPDIGKVLIVCESGNERSAALVIAYLLEITDLSLIEACQLVQNQRFAVNVDDELKWTLKGFEEYLAAKRMVTGNGENGRPQPVRRQSIMCNIPTRTEGPDVNGGGRRSSTKRRLDEDEDGTDEMEWGQDDTMSGVNGHDGTDATANASAFQANRGRSFAPFKADG